MRKGASSGGGRRSSAIELTNHLTTLSESSSSLTVGDPVGCSSLVTSPVGGGESGAGFSNRSSSSSTSKTSNDSWVCPNDRQLALRAKLKSGWSVKTANLNQWKQPNPMSTNEHDIILQVIEKAEAMERAEQQRVGRLVDRLEGMKRCCLGNGETDCILCGEVFRFYHRSHRRCSRCHKMTCGKCGVESGVSSSGLTVSSSSQTSTIWLCKICNEGKEMWKKSGAWFYKGMPKYILPETGKGYRHDRRHSHYAPLSNNGKPGGFMSAFGAVGGGMSTSLGGSPIGSHDDLGFRSGSLPGGTKGLHHSDEEDEEDEVVDEDEDSDEVADGMLARRRRALHHRRLVKNESLGGDSSQFSDDSGGACSKFKSGSEDSSRSLPINIPLSTRSGGSTPGPSTPPYNFPPGARSSSQGPSTPTGCRYYGPPMTGSPARYCRPLPPPIPPPRGISSYRGHRHPHHPPHFRPSGGSPPFSPRGPPVGMMMVRRGGAGPPPRVRYPRSFRGGRPPPRCPPQIVSQSAPHSPISPQRIFPGGSGPCCGIVSTSPVSTTVSPELRSGKNDETLTEFMASSSVAVSANIQAKLAAEKLLQEMNRSDDLLGRAAAKAAAVANKISSEVQEESGGNNREDEEEPDEEDPEYDEEEEVPTPARTSIASDDDSSLNAPIKYNKAKPLNEKENKFTSTLRRLSTVRRRSKTKRKSFLDKDDNDNNGDKSKEGSGVEDGLSRGDSHGRGDGNSRSQEAPSYGVVEFNLIFDEVNQVLTVNMIKAKRIKGMDINGLSDSYCKVTISHSVGKTYNQQCTKTVAKNINPHYNAMLHFKGVNQSVIQNGSLQLAVLDEDLSGDHLLAEAALPLNKIMPQMQRKFQIPLDKPDLKDTHDGLIVTSNVGRVEISLAFYSKAGTLRVGILRCFDLPHMVEDGNTNPFVQTQLYPGSKHSRHKTTVKWRTVNPEYHEQFVYLTSITELPKQSLHITVWDKEKSKAEEYIGGIILGLNAKGGRLQHWADMVKHPNQVHVKTHFLSANFLD